MKVTQSIIRRRRWCALIAVPVALIAVSCSSLNAGTWPALVEVAQSSTRSLTLSFRVSYCSNLFYLVDQLSRWDPVTRFYYRDYWERRFGLTQEDLKILDRYSHIRAMYPWGVLEPAFYGPGDDRAVQSRLNKIIPHRDVRVIWATLEHFKSKFDQIWKEVDYLPRMAQKLAINLTADRKQLFEEAANFFGAPALSLEVLAIWSPEQKFGGGGFNGGRIALEMPRGRPLERIMAVLFHEAFHAFQEPRQQEMTVFGAKQGIPDEVMHEAIMYAIAPGVFAHRNGFSDPLPIHIAEMEKSDVSPEDTLLQIRKLALAMEPLTDQYLRQGKKLEEYLPQLAKTWQRLLKSDFYLKQLEELAERPARAGLGLKTEGKRLIVMSLLPGSPSELQGIKVGDEIVAVRGKTLEVWGLEGVSPGKVGWRELRGEPGETVCVMVKRDSHELNFRLRLSVMEWPSERPSEPQVAAICRREVAEALNARLKLYMDAFSPKFIGSKLNVIKRIPLIIAISPDEITIPDQFHYLLPMDYEQITAYLNRRKVITSEKMMAGRLVVLLAAPNQQRLLDLIREYDFSRVLRAVLEKEHSAPQSHGKTIRQLAQRHIGPTQKNIDQKSPLSCPRVSSSGMSATGVVSAFFSDWTFF